MTCLRRSVWMSGGWLRQSATPAGMWATEPFLGHGRMVIRTGVRRPVAVMLELCTGAEVLACFLGGAMGTTIQIGATLYTLRCDEKDGGMYLSVFDGSLYTCIFVVDYEDA